MDAIARLQLEIDARKERKKAWHRKAVENMKAKEGYKEKERARRRVASKKWRAENPERWKAIQKHHRNVLRNKRKRMLMDLFDNKCADCKCTYPPCVFDFHHLDPSKKEAKHFSLFWTEKRLLKEMEGCTMLCSNCHRIRHSKQEEEDDNTSS